MPILGLDTATARGSVALAESGRLLAEQALEERGAHARDLLSRVDALLHEAGIEPRRLTGIGVAVGPGSFTGVRIGMATAKGLAYSLQIALAGLSTLEAMARAAGGALQEPPGILCPVIAAGRGEVYAALFRVPAGGAVERLTPDRSWRPPDLASELPRVAVLVGDAGGTLAAAARSRGLEFRVLESCPPLAGAIALWAGEAIPPGAGFRAGEPRPNYVRPSDAEPARRRS
jgi:tRNA threonylcarbamoyladenosine biosynthesis protein TsaB